LRQQAFLKSLGFFDPTPVELIEAPGAAPADARSAGPRSSTITTSYGHGMSASPMHLAAAYAAIANGGRAVKPTL
jgi:cell division protein FtsI (penicillin-binding protein 3)